MGKKDRGLIGICVKGRRIYHLAGYVEFGVINKS
jgi:hypothetical protein